MDLAEDMYKVELLEHYNNPQNYGKIIDADAVYHDFNPVCGDEIDVYLKINTDILEDVKFTGKGCAISQGAASIVTEYLKGKRLDEVKSMTKEQMLELLPIEVSYLRVKCAMMALRAVQKGLMLKNKKMNKND